MSLTRADLKRRDLLRAAALAGIAGSPVLTACATPDPVSSEPAAQGKISAANPLGVPRDKPVEIVIFDGGFGDEYATRIHEPLLTVRHAGLQVKHVATKEISKTLQPRFAGGNPPEVVNNDGADEMDLGALSADGQMADLTPLLEAPAWDQPGKKVRDVLVPAAIERGTFGGKFYAVYYNLVTWGIWYSGPLFQRNGWQPPTTWEAFLALCEQIKKSGVAPFFHLRGQASRIRAGAVADHSRQSGRAGGAEEHRQPGRRRVAGRAGPAGGGRLAGDRCQISAAGHRRHQPHRVPGQAEHR